MIASDPIAPHLNAVPTLCPEEPKPFAGLRKKPNLLLIITDQEREVMHWPEGWGEEDLTARSGGAAVEVNTAPQDSRIQLHHGRLPNTIHLPWPFPPRPRLITSHWQLNAGPNPGIPPQIGATDRLKTARHAFAAALPATVPLLQLHWKLNAGPNAGLWVAIGHYVLGSANMAKGCVAVRDR